jgi:hypothetical protein
MIPSFDPHYSGGPARSTEKGGHAHISAEQRDIFSLEADAAGLVLQYEYTFGDQLRRQEWEPVCGEGFYELEALRGAGEYLGRAFSGGRSSSGAVADESFESNPELGCSDDMSGEPLPHFDRQIDPEIDGFEVSRKVAYTRQNGSNADVVVLYEVKPDRPVASPHWAFPDVSSENSLADFGHHLELLNPVFVQVARIDGATSHRLVFSEKGGEEVIELATRDIGRMPNEFLFGLKDQLLKLSGSTNSKGNGELKHEDLRIRALDSSPENGEILIEAYPLGAYRLKLHYEPRTSKVVTSAGRIEGVH